ncbi:MAG: hypothetical protein K6A23_04165 [Butyrivibrio sp.]|nr:hypothetical protein [Butyrivibrio sp.]
MYYYSLYGQTIVSDIEFRQLVKSTDTEASIYINEGNIPEDILSTPEKYKINDERSFLSNKTCYLVITDGNKIIYKLKPDGNENYLRSFILGYGMAMLFLQRGEIAVHCSALSTNNGAVIIAGESGSGKSTITTALLNEGMSLMADDMAIVSPGENSAIAYPAFPYQKLCRDAALSNNEDLSKLIYIDEDKDKFLIPYKGNFDLSGYPVKAMFVLLGEVDSDKIELQEIKGFQKMLICANNLFLRKLLKDDKYKGTSGKKCFEISDKFPIYVLGRPAGKNSLDEMKAMILEKLNN